MVTCIIADDEPMLRAQLRKLLAVAWPELEVVAEAEDGLQAQEAIIGNQPTIAFLDIQMPGMTGIELAPLVSCRTHVVLVTAHEQFALKAFESGVAEYVTKPIDHARLAAAVERLRKRVLSAPATVTAESLQPLPPKSGWIQWVNVDLSERNDPQDIRFVPIDEVAYINVDSSGTFLNLASGETLRVKKPLSEFAAELDPDVFWQVHRGLIVCIKHMRGVAKLDNGNLAVRMKREVPLKYMTVSRPYEYKFRRVTALSD